MRRIPPIPALRLDAPALLAAALLAGCSQQQIETRLPTPNPNPVARYEVTVEVSSADRAISSSDEVLLFHVKDEVQECAPELESGAKASANDGKRKSQDLFTYWPDPVGRDELPLNPFLERRPTLRWNPLHYVSERPADRLSDLRGVAAVIYPDGGEEAVRTSEVRNLFLALALYTFERHDREVADGLPFQLRRPPTLGRVYRISTDGTQAELKAHLHELSRGEFLSDPARSLFGSVLSHDPATVASIMERFRRPLNAWADPTLDAATSIDDFRLDDLRPRDTWIHVGIQREKLPESQLIIDLLFDRLISIRPERIPHSTVAPERPCLLLRRRIDVIPQGVRDSERALRPQPAFFPATPSA